MGIRGMQEVYDVIWGYKDKDRDNKMQISGIIYKFKCQHINCSEEYIGISGRTLGHRVKEHIRAPSTNTTTLQDIQSVQTASPQYIGKHKKHQGDPVHLGK